MPPLIRHDLPHQHMREEAQTEERGGREGWGKERERARGRERERDEY